MQVAVAVVFRAPPAGSCLYMTRGWRENERTKDCRDMLLAIGGAAMLCTGVLIGERLLLPRTLTLLAEWARVVCCLCMEARSEKTVSAETTPMCRRDLQIKRTCVAQTHTMTERIAAFLSRSCADNSDVSTIIPSSHLESNATLCPVCEFVPPTPSLSAISFHTYLLMFPSAELTKVDAPLLVSDVAGAAAHAHMLLAAPDVVRWLAVKVENSMLLSFQIAH